MLELSKQILKKVSFDKVLFRKELTKAVLWLKAEEKMLLKIWCLSTFGHLYKDVIQEVYTNLVTLA